MLHLSTERLASLADDEPSASEAIHLASCPRCATERRTHQQLLLAARKQGNREETPLTSWESLSPRLAAEGLFAEKSQSRFASRALRRVSAVAASLALVAGGTVAGRMSAGASLLPTQLFSRASDSTATAVADFTSTAEAMNVYLSSQRDYQRAAAYLAANDKSAPDAQSTYLTRLAAFEQIHAASVAALREAPNDPVLNNLYVQSLSSTDAARKQLSQFISVGGRVRDY